MSRVGTFGRILSRWASCQSYLPFASVTQCGSVSSQQLLDLCSLSMNLGGVLGAQDLGRCVWKEGQMWRGISQVGSSASGMEDAAQMSSQALAVDRPDEMSPSDIFDKAWQAVEVKYGQDLVIPREIIFLNGAPGAGKGANTPFILKSRGLGRAIAVSDILVANRASKALMDSGDLIPDDVVLEALFSEILGPAIDDAAGLIIDGFPRTESQVDSVKLFYDRLMSIHKKFAGTSRANYCPRPSFKMVMLYVNETTSINRQMGRGHMMSVKNARARDAGSDNLVTVRNTDINEDYCMKRYQTFKEHYGAILRLKDVFPFHVIDSMGSLDDTRKQIATELRYQSSDDLLEETYAAIRHLMKARDVSSNARRQLPGRLDSYASTQRQIFNMVIKIIEDSLVPILNRCGMAGETVFKTGDKMFLEHPIAINMLIDVLTDRGFQVWYEEEKKYVPTKVDLSSGSIHCSIEIIHHFRIKFRVSSVRADAEKAWDPTI